MNPILEARSSHWGVSELMHCGSGDTDGISVSDTVDGICSVEILVESLSDGSDVVAGRSGVSEEVARTIVGRDVVAGNSVDMDVGDSNVGRDEVDRSSSEDEVDGLVDRDGVDKEVDSNEVDELADGDDDDSGPPDDVLRPVLILDMLREVDRAKEEDGNGLDELEALLKRDCTTLLEVEEDCEPVVRLVAVVNDS